MNPGPYNEKLRRFAEERLQKLNIRVQEHGRVELTPTMAFVEAMVAVPLDVNGEPWCSGDIAEDLAKIPTPSCEVSFRREYRLKPTKKGKKK